MAGMTESAAVQLARAAFFRHFAWAEGHADVWAIFADAAAFAAVVNGLAAPWRNVGITHIVGVEARGFLLGGAVAAELGAGFVAVRKPGGLLPGPKARVVASTDYRGIAHQLRVQRVLRPQDVALLVDDWAERAVKRPLSGNS
jgi:adenine/guanine phosphoribosyltransferase-like PRPP-binding protein